MRFFPQTVYCWGSQCFLSVSALTGMLCLPRWACLGSCLPPHLPSGLGCCVRLAGLVSGLVSGLVCHLGSLGCLRSCLPACLPSGLGCSVASLVLSFSCLWSCLPAFVFVLSRSLSFIWDAVSAPPLGLSFSCPWSCLPACLPSGLGCCVRLLGSSPSPACLRSFCPILFSSWSGVSVLWACLQNFRCDLCNCLGSTVV